MAEENLGSAKLVLTADDKDLSDKLRAAKQQVDELARQAGTAGDAFSKFFSRTYRLNINDSQLQAANTRLTNLKTKLTEISSKPFNVRLNVLESGLAGGGKDISRERLLKGFQAATRGGLSGQLTDILAGDIGGLRTADLRSTLAARLQRGSLGAGGFNVPGLREVITQLGGTPSGSRGELVKQAQDLLKNVGDAVINKVGQDLLDLKLQLTEGAEGGETAPIGRPSQDPELRRQKALSRLIGLQTRVNALEVKGVNVAAQRAQLQTATNSLTEDNFRAAALTTQRLENVVKLEEGRLKIENLRQQQAKRQGGLGFATTPEEILAGRGGQRKGGALGIEAFNKALDKRLGLEQRISVLDAQGINVANLRTQVSRIQQETNVGNLGTANKLLTTLQRQVKAEESTLRVSKLRVATAKKLAAATAAPSGAQTPTQRRAADQATKRNRDILSNALIGGAFPLLFGQGIGASIGGAGGGAAGGAIGGQFGFGLSLVGTALGAQFDEIINKAATLGKALQDPIRNFSAIQESALLSSRGLERQVESLIAVGREAEAAALIQADLAKAYGGAEAARRLASEQDRLSRSWTQLSINLGQLFLPSVADSAGDAASALSGLNAILQNLGKLPLPKPQGVAGGVPGISELINPLAAVIGVAAALGRRSAPRDRDGSAEELTAAAKAAATFEEQRNDLLSAQTGAITAQVQGYKRLALERELDVSRLQQATDLENLRARGAQAPELSARAQQGNLERFRLQEELNQLVREEQVLQTTRGPILQTQLDLIKAQSQGLERQSLILQRQLIDQEAAQQIALRPGERGRIEDRAALDRARINAELQAATRRQELAQLQRTAALRSAALNTQRSLASAQFAPAFGDTQTQQTTKQITQELRQISLNFVEAESAVADAVARLRVVQQTRDPEQIADAANALDIARQGLQKSGIDFAASIRQAAVSLLENAQTSAVVFRDAVRGLRDLRLGNLRFLPAQQRESLLGQERRRGLPEATRRGVALRGIDDLIGFNRFVEQETAARQNVADAERNLTQANQALNNSIVNQTGVMGQLTGVMERLVDKSWAVYVQVPGQNTAGAINLQTALN